MDENYKNILPNTYLIFYGVSIIVVAYLIIKSCKKRENGQNRLRREYMV